MLEYKTMGYVEQPLDFKGFWFTSDMWRNENCLSYSTG